MGSMEKKLDNYINKLNAEKKPDEHGKAINPPELEGLLKTARLVHTLKEPAMPDGEFVKRLAAESERVNEHSGKKSKMPAKRAWLVGAASIAAVLAMVLILNFVLPFGGSNIVYAMEAKIESVKAYHGFLEFTETNAEGKTTTQARLEVWSDKQDRYYVRELEGAQKGLITVNSGDRKWQLRPDEKQAYVFPAFPDPYRFTFELGKELDNVKNAVKTEVIGEENVSGRDTTVLEVTPQGGEPYKLWIDKETKLPLKKQSAMQNALQYTVSYTSIEFSEVIPAQLISYSLPEGYKEINTNPLQMVTNPAEAQEVAGFSPVMPAAVPEGYEMDGMAVETLKKIVEISYNDTIDKKRVVVRETKADGELKPSSGSVLAAIGGNAAEIQSPVQGIEGALGGGAYAGVTDINSIRWQQNGLEYAVVGNLTVEDLAQFTKDLGLGSVELPTKDVGLSAKPKVEVPIDLEAEKNEQKSVDAGHSPWKLDPAFVAQVFVSLKISPEGITGEYPVKYEDLKLTKNTGNEAVVEVGAGNAPVSKVYLKRLIRQDSTGIWTVVGYDPAG